MAEEFDWSKVSKLVVSDELCMCIFLAKQITYDRKHVPSRALCPYRGTALKHPHNSKYTIIF